MNYSQKLYEVLKLVCLLVIVYAENDQSHSNIIISVPFFILDFNLLSYELENFTFTLLY